MRSLPHRKYELEDSNLWSTTENHMCMKGKFQKNQKMDLDVETREAIIYHDHQFQNLSAMKQRPIMDVEDQNVRTVTD